MLSIYYKMFLNCFFYLLQLLALFFPVELRDVLLYNNDWWIFKRIYAVFLSLLLAFSYIYLQWLEIRSVFKVRRTSNIILQALTHTCFTIICLMCCLGTVFWNKSKFGHYLKLQRVLKTKMKLKIMRSSLHFCVEFFIGHAILFVMSGIDILRAFNMDSFRTNELLSMILKQILLYYVFLITFLIYNNVLFLKNSFHTLRLFLTSTVRLEENDGLFTLYRPTQQGKMVTFPIAIIGGKTLFEISEASKVLNILFECVNIFNDVFGQVLVFINVSTILTILSALNTLLVSGENNQLSTALILTCLSEAIILLVWISFILGASGRLKVEYCQIVKVCCKLQHLLPQSSQERKELLNIAHQVRRKAPRISAAGFFDIDFYLIIGLFTYVGTYTVVLIQFSHMNF